MHLEVQQLDTGTLRGDLLLLGDTVAHFLTQPVGRALTSAVFAEDTAPSIAALARRRLQESAGGPAATMVGRAMARGEWRDDAPDGFDGFDFVVTNTASGYGRAFVSPPWAEVGGAKPVSTSTPELTLERHRERRSPGTEGRRRPARHHQRAAQLGPRSIDGGPWINRTRRRWWPKLHICQMPLPAARRPLRHQRRLRHDR